MIDCRTTVVLFVMSESSKSLKCWDLCKKWTSELVKVNCLHYYVKLLL